MVHFWGVMLIVWWNRLLESGNLADAEIICNGRVWKVHKLILRSRCVWFEKVFANNWQEAQTDRINLEEQDPERVNDILKYIYSGREFSYFDTGRIFQVNPALCPRT
jgi:hypothetical protein